MANRIKHAKPKLIVTASCGIEPNRTIPYVPIIDKALNEAGHPDMKRIIVQRNYHRAEKLNNTLYLDYEEEMAKVNKGHDPVPVPSEHPFFILYTSGTTGNPKGIYRS